MMNFAIIFSCGLGGLLAGLLYSYVGGTGVNRNHSTRIGSLEDAVDVLSTRLTSEIRRRSAEKSTESRKQNETLKEEAERRLMERQQPAQDDLLPFQSFSNYAKRQ